MAQRIAFLRAINLGARRKFSAQQICDAALAAGFSDPATHLNTGNLRVGTTLRSRERIEAALEAAFADAAGFEVPTVVLTPEELRSTLTTADRLATEAGRDPADLGHHVTFLKRAPDPAAVAGLTAATPEGETAVVEGRVVHLLLGPQFHTSRLAPLVERHLGPGTARRTTVVRELVRRWC